MRWGIVFGLGFSIFVSRAFAQFEPAAPAEKPTVVQVPPQPSEPAPSDAGASQDVRALLIDLRNGAAPINVRQAAVDKLLANGDVDVQRVIDFTSKELKARRKAYDAKLESSAAQVLAARWKATGNIEREVESIRKPAVDVSRGPGLTKERIHSDVDPALKKLDALLSLDVPTVFKEKPELARLREEIFFLADANRAGAAKLSAEARKRDASSKGASVPSRPDLEAALVSEEQQAVALAIPMTPEDRKVLAANATLAPSIPAGEAEGILILNRIRIKMGIGALLIDAHLCDAARGHSTDMKERNFFAHESPVAGKETPWKRAALAGTSASGENIYMGSTKAPDAIDGWWYSPGHHANMMAAHRRIGLGMKDGYWTMMLGD